VPDLFEQIQKNIQSRVLLKRGQRLLVAVSGGLDSMVLLDVLDRLRVGERWRITVAHLNHRLRGRSSDADERLVRKAAKAQGLPIVVQQAEVRALAAREKLSIEMAARKARHEFFVRVARDRRIRSVALAHHADDQVELFFLRLFRGSGSEGLAGMKWQNRSPVCSEIELVRPLLNISKSELRKYALRNRVVFREDATNQSLEIQRNRIRHELLPLLRKNYQPAIAETVLRGTEIVGAEAEYVYEMARKWLKSGRSDFQNLPLAMQRRVLQIQLTDNGVLPEYDLVEKLRITPDHAVAVARPVGRVNMSPGAARTPLKRGLKAREEEVALGVFRDKRGRVQLRQLVASDFRTETRRVSISRSSGSIEFGGAMIEWVLRRQAGKDFPKFRPGAEFFDGDKVGSTIVLRHWQPGDRFQPIGMSVAVKVQDLLVNQKVPKDVRKGLIVATTASGELFWVEKLRISERFRLTSETKRRLQWRWRRD
jgi:tRNA(Ile)-lysidine synthase